MGTLTTRIAAMASRLAAVDFSRPSDPGERVAYEMKLEAIRSEARDRSAGERVLLYMGASDPLVVDAFESAPPILSADGREFVPFVDPERVRARRAERARASNPELAKEMADLEDLSGAYVALIDSVRRSIAEQVAGIIDENAGERQKAAFQRAAVGAQ